MDYCRVTVGKAALKARRRRCLLDGDEIDITAACLVGLGHRGEGQACVAALSWLKQTRTINYAKGDIHSLLFPSCLFVSFQLYYISVIYIVIFLAVGSRPPRMEKQVTRLVDKAWEGFQKTPEDQRYREFGPDFACLCYMARQTTDEGSTLVN